MLLLTLVPLVFASHAVASAASFPTPAPVSDSYASYAVVLGPTPGKPTITNLINGASFTTAEPVQVQGHCNDGELVKVFKNEILAGAAYCAANSYRISIDLFIGTNSVIARAYNANDTVGPDSTTVGVQLQLPGTSLNGTGQLSSQDASAGQFYLTSGITHRGVAVGDTSSWTLVAAGGQAPYAVSVSWGDGKTDLYSRGEGGKFDIEHSYAKLTSTGSFTVVIKASDQSGNKSYLQLATLVSSDKKPAGVVGSIKSGYNGSTAVRIGWQLLGAAVLVVASFWFGERRELKLLRS